MAPENTLPALELAVEAGFQMLEIDVQQSADGVLYDLHDAEVSRTTDGRGLARLMSSRRIDRLDAGSWFGPEFRGTRVPRVREVLERFHDRVMFYFDVKPGVQISRLVRLVREYDLAERSLFWFKSRRSAGRLARRHPDLCLKINAGTVAEIDRAMRFHPVVIECSYSLFSPSLREACRNRGLMLMVAVHGSERRALSDPEVCTADILNLDAARPLLEQRDE